MRKNTLLNETQKLTADTEHRFESQEPTKVLPFPDRTKQPAITPEYIAQLCHQTTCGNTRRAHLQDKRYFWRWAKAFNGLEEHYPVTVELIQQFLIAHTLEINPVIDKQLIASGIKKKQGPYKMTTLSRILSTISREHQILNLDNPVIQPQVKLLKRQLKKLQPDLSAHSKKAITLAVLEQMLKTCDKTSAMGLRDRALLLVGFASGGRRRSELSHFRYEDLTIVPSGFLLLLRKLKNDQIAEGKLLPVFGKSAIALRQWLKVSKIQSGFLYRSVSKSGAIGKNLSDKAIDNIVKKRIRLAGLNPKEFSAHSLRSGFLTETGKQGIALSDAMQLSTHKTQAVAFSYYREGSLSNNPASNLTG